jgi:site-specific recombinase XerD
MQRALLTQRILLMTLYATSAHRTELTHLKVSDIDSQRMVVHIRSGKGHKDRDVMLGPKLLTTLRTHWRCYHRKSSTWESQSDTARAEAHRVSRVGESGFMPQI